MKAIRNILVGLALVSSAAAYAYDMPATMYLVGDATPAGWNSGDPYPMTKVENNTFVWEGNLYHNGSAEIAVEAEGAEEVYDLAGRRVDLDNAPAGIYIVRKGGETRKVAIR